MSGYSLPYCLTSAKDICGVCGIDLNKPFDHERMVVVQNKYLSPRDVQLVVIDKEDGCKLFAGPKCPYQLTLFYTENKENNGSYGHYDALAQFARCVVAR
jgi:hypothetical protein